MRDGVKLSAFVFRPAGEGRWPVILEQRYANGNNSSVTAQFSKLAAHGYVVVLANFRGSQESEGVWQGYRALGWGDLKDGYDLVEWLAVQPWSTGKVGTFGSSQAGFAQNFLAVAGPPHLTAQYMIDTGLSLYHEGYRIGGTSRPERFKELSKVCRVPEHNDALLAEWSQHPTFDDYWAAEDCSLHFDKMNVPCFTIGSWYDFMCVGSVDSYVGRQHRGGPNSRGQQQLLCGPWLHGRVKEVNVTGEMTYPENAKFPLDDHLIRWFDHYLKGIDNGVERDPSIKREAERALDDLLAYLPVLPLDVIARDGLACEVSLVRGEVAIQPIARTATSPGLEGAALGYSTSVYGGKPWRTYVLQVGEVRIATAE
ncbi:MAG: hypothetical protein B7Z55_16725, partial [Planctomycetales bacterium 12-60-4]